MHISSYHRFFSRARWTTDAVGLTLADLVIDKLLPHGVIRLVVDDTLGRHTGKRIAAASMHRDPLLSTGRRPFLHWGHVWVVLSIEVELFSKSWALPVLFRLHRNEKRCKAEKRSPCSGTCSMVSAVGPRDSLCSPGTSTRPGPLSATCSRHYAEPLGDKDFLIRRLRRVT